RAKEVFASEKRSGKALNPNWRDRGDRKKSDRGDRPERGER
ncbi:MAG TPA: 30S ribosomal protein S3, partial [Verrucomicrobiales bacterium]|nr:30S ribosomal protein S3 [Verrucomicrobiales bacterium]